MKEILPKTREWLNKIAKPIVYSTILFHAGTQAMYTSNTIAHQVLPSKERAAFRKEFGCPILGYTEDIENTKNISIIAETLEKERLVQPFQIDGLRIRSNNYLQKSIIQQADDLFYAPNGGFYLCNIIVLDNKFYPAIISHEIKHAKAKAMMDKHPEFTKEWNSLAVDANGNSLYYTFTDEICSKIKGLEEFIDADKSDLMKNRQIGFISNYARTNIHEDIAELCENAENYSFMLELSLANDKNCILAKKIKLAEKYKLIPPEFSEYMALDKKIKNIIWNIKDKKSNESIIASQEFLNKNKISIYEAGIRFRIGLFLERHMKTTNPKAINETIDEYKKALTAKFKPRYEYEQCLKRLAVCYRINGDSKKSELYENAVALYTKRYYDNDVKLFRTGVNDYLMQNHETLLCKQQSTLK